MLGCHTECGYRKAQRVANDDAAVCNDFIYGLAEPGALATQSNVTFEDRSIR